MCWSAEADLVAGVGITAVGVACVVRARRAGRTRDLPLAALSLLLGAHQLIEAAVWAGDGGTGPATLAWAVIALPLLPLWVPVGVALAAPPRARPRLLVPLITGVATAAVLSYVLATREVRADIRGHTVGYVVGLPHAELLIAAYLLATVGSLLLSRDRALIGLGALVAVGAAVCAVLWRTEFVSTWCAVAAACSVVLWRWTGDRGASTGAAGLVRS